jgi:para-nitrobenzyl esterase
MAGQRDAARPGPSCLQNDYGWNHVDYVRASEDCLTLDVATPALDGKRPVMVWIHGGSNRAGSAGETVRASLVRRGVVLVAVQYRLGLLGNLPHRALAAEQGGHTGNYGLMDQIAALRWVQANIARFGGDPANVTIFGDRQERRMLACCWPRRRPGPVRPRHSGKRHTLLRPVLAPARSGPAPWRSA